MREVCGRSEGLLMVSEGLPPREALASLGVSPGVRLPKPGRPKLVDQLRRVLRLAVTSCER